MNKVTVMLDDDSALVMPYDDAMRLYLRLRWALDKARLTTVESTV